MGKFLRENLVLVAGIVLPVLLVAGFLVLEHLPGAIVDPPGYDLLLAGYRNEYPAGGPHVVTFDVRNGVLHGQVSPPDTASPYRNRYSELYRFDTDTGTLTEIEVELPAGLDELTEPISFPVGETAGWKLDASTRAPDGYTFETDDRRGSGLLGEIFGFGGRRSRSPYVLVKDGVAQEVPLPRRPGYYYHTVVLLAWILETDTR